MLSALIFVLFNLVCYALAVARGPVWAIVAYMNVYFNPPDSLVNWWASYIPFSRWSLLTTAVLLGSIIIHKSGLSGHPFRNVKWGFIFFLLSAVICLTVDTYKEAGDHLYLLFTYCLIMFCMIKAIKSEDQLKLVYLFITIFIGVLSLDAYLDGNRVNARLEGTGSADANGSNEFALLLSGTIPFIFVFLLNGTKAERLIALAVTPFALNAFVLCNSRGGFVALIGGIGIATLLVADRAMRRGIIMLSILIAPVFVYLTDPEFISRFTTLFSYQQAIENEENARQLSSGRTEIWLYGVEMAKDHPFGIGPNGFKQIARFYMPEEILTFRPGAQYGVRSAHNTYIQVLVEQGVIGFIIWLFLCLSTGRLLYSAFKISSKLKEPRRFLKNSIFASNVGFYSILLGGMLNSRVYYEYFWWQLAFASIAYSIASDYLEVEKAEEEEQAETEATSILAGDGRLAH